MNAVAGVATFAGCKIDKAATGYVLTATDGSLTSASSSAFNVTVGTAARWGFTTQPGGGTAGAAWPAQPVVAIQDAGGNTVTTASATATLAIGTEPWHRHAHMHRRPRQGYDFWRSHVRGL